ncbi:MAG TPA: DUF2971 domain-containing protein [Chryseolinea sp.]|nr:DUF2971 domain-containing protein [Chryseolinea sp.]
MKLRIGSIGETNDPRETKEWGFSILNPPDVVPINFLALMSDVQVEMNQIRLKEWSVVCLTQDNPDLILSDENSPDFSYELWGYSHPRMWAHYALNHTGVCLVFDGDSLHQSIINAVSMSARVFCGPVVYGSEHNVNKKDPSAYQVDWNSLSINLQAGLRKHILDHYRQFFLHKAKDWNTECEFRWLVHANESPFFADILYSLREVIVGMDFHNSYLPNLINLCNCRNIKISRMNWQNRTPFKSYL